MAEFRADPRPRHPRRGPGEPRLVGEPKCRHRIATRLFAIHNGGCPICDYTAIGKLEARIDRAVEMLEKTGTPGYTLEVDDVIAALKGARRG